jgi:hypothetical protein
MLDQDAVDEVCQVIDDYLDDVMTWPYEVK